MKNPAKALIIAGAVAALSLMSAAIVLGGNTLPGREAETAPSEQRPVTSIDLVDTGKCDLIHNVEACGPEMADLARQDLAARLGLDPGAIDLILQERVDWPDASLGAPQSGEFYAQVITPGYRLILEADGHSYEYHTGLTPALPQVVLVN